jgi:hypothetical protein
MESVERIVKLIRERYSKDIPIILAADSGFFDQKAFEFFEDTLKINYVVTGKLFKYMKSLHNLKNKLIKTHYFSNLSKSNY